MKTFVKEIVLDAQYHWVNIQDDRGKAKAYQVKQVLKAIERLESEYGTHG